MCQNFGKLTATQEPCQVNSSPAAETDEGLGFVVGFEVDFLVK